MTAGKRKDNEVANGRKAAGNFHCHSTIPKYFGTLTY